MKKYLILLLNVSILLSNNISLVELFSNDYPVWLEFPIQSIDEDCQNGCTEEEFLFDLESYVSDPDEDDIITIDEPILLSGSASVSINEFILKIIPNLNYFGDIIVELEATDGELSSLTNFTLQVLPINDIPLINDQLEISIDEDCGGDSCNGDNKLMLSLDMFDANDIEDPDDLVLHIDASNPGEHYTAADGLGILINQDYNGQITVPVYVEDLEGGQSEVFDCIIDVTSINDMPYFSNLGDITIDEDNVYEEVWAFDISSGADNEIQDIFFIINFEDLDLIQESNLTPEGLLTIIPSNNKYGETTFNVRIADDSDSGFSDEFISSLVINSINDIPLINSQIEISIDEDCGEDSCDGDNKLILSLDMFDTEDIEQPESLILYIDQANIDNHYVTDGGLGIFLEQDYNGQITVPVYVEDLEGGQSEVFDCIIDVTSINDIPYFSNLGNIVMSEDCGEQICNENNYYSELWAFDVSAGGNNWNLYENQDISFEITFSNPDLINNYSLSYTNDNTGKLIIELAEHANGSTDFEVYLEDEEGLRSITDTLNLTINAINDAPSFNEHTNEFDLDEDTNTTSFSWAYNISPGGGNGIYEETDQILEFIIEDGYDESLFSENPNISITDNEGILSFTLDDDMNGQTEFLCFLQDNGDNLNGGDSTSDIKTINININQINDSPEEFLIFSNLENYQQDLSTFYQGQEHIYFRYPYQPVYIDNQNPNKLRFEWEWIDSLDIDTYPSINKDILMENTYYRLEMVETNNSENIIVLSDSLIYGGSDSNIDYQTDYDNNIVSIDLDLTLFSDKIDLTGNTSYNWQVVSQNYQFDAYDNDPNYAATNQDYFFHTDLTLPTSDMVYLHDDIFEEHFDLYMLGNEEFFDFDGLNRPIKLWAYYNSQDDIESEIFFPELYDTLNNIYYLSHNFIYSGDINFIYQTRDKAQNINQGSHDVSFGIINPISESIINFSNNLLKLEVPSGSTDDVVSCLISSNENDDFNINVIGDIIEIIPQNIQLNKAAILSFNLDMISEEYDNSNLAIYTLDGDIWILCDTYIKGNFISSKIHTFGKYAIIYNQNHETDILPDDYMLVQNYPNPFNPQTTIEYYLPSSNFIKLNIYNIEGKKVNTLYNGYSESGYHTIYWNGNNDKGSTLSSGIYILSLEYNNIVLNRKMVKIK